MKLYFRIVLLAMSMSLVFSSAWADEYTNSKKMFEDAGISSMFTDSYGYALYPTIIKAAAVVGGAYGPGKVYEQGKYIGDTAMTQASIGYQIGGSGYGQVIFFENKATLDKFIQGKFELGAEAQATALTIGVGGAAKTTGTGATASLSKETAAVHSGGYVNGMAIYTITQGGAMIEASVAGQLFEFKGM